MGKNLERWIPGYLIRNRADKSRLAIVEGDYNYLHDSRGFDTFAVCELGEDGEIKSNWAWAHRDQWELVDTEHVVENLIKMVNYKGKRFVE